MEVLKCEAFHCLGSIIQKSSKIKEGVEHIIETEWITEVLCEKRC